MVKFPDEEIDKPTPHFLSPDECRAVIRRLEEDRGDTGVEEFSLARFFKPAKNIEIWGFAFIFL